MTHYKSIVLAGVVAVSGAMAASDVDAMPFDLSGTFTIDIANYEPNGGNNTIRDQQSEATETNFNDVFGVGGGTPTISSVIDTGSVTWTGTLNFNAVPSADNTTPEDQSASDGTAITTISDFFASNSGGGSITGGGLGTLANNTLSAGGGSNDGGLNNNDRSNITTLFRITASSLNIADMSQIVNVRHDDGMTLSDGTKAIAFVGPNGERNTPVSGLTGTNFTLYYAAANGDPSILQVQAVPLPAAAWLLLGVSGALVAAKRRSARRAA